MAILLPIQMVLVLLQCWPAQATMVNTQAYSDSACTTQIADEWGTADVCAPHSPSQGYYKWTCNGANAEARIYSDAACTNLKSTYNEAPFVVNGVYASNGACFDTNRSSRPYEKHLCSNQPAQMKFNQFTDASCTAANHSEGPARKFALDGCQYKPKEENGVVTGVEAEKFTGSASQLSRSKYTDKTCTTASTDTDTKYNLALTDANTCHMIEEGKYFKFVSISTAAEAEAQAAASGPGTTASTSGSGTGTASGSVSIRASLMAMLMLVKALL